MKKSCIILFAAILLATAADAQLTLNGITLPAKVNKDNTELVLNGGGIRKKMFFKLYSAGLYATAKTKNSADVWTADKAVAMRLVITSSVISSDNMKFNLSWFLFKIFQKYTSLFFNHLQILN